MVRRRAVVRRAIVSRAARVGAGSPSALPHPLHPYAPSLHPHCTLIASSLHPRCILATPSLHPRCILAAPSLHPHCTLAAPSLRPHCTLAAPSLHPHCALIAPSLHPRCTLAAPLQARGSAVAQGFSGAQLHALPRRAPSFLVIPLVPKLSPLVSPQLHALPRRAFPDPNPNLDPNPNSDPKPYPKPYPRPLPSPPPLPLPPPPLPLLPCPPPSPPGLTAGAKMHKHYSLLCAGWVWICFARLDPYFFLPHDICSSSSHLCAFITSWNIVSGD